MKIADLKKDYPLVYRQALDNQILAGNVENDQIYINKTSNEGKFIFRDTSEGESFWLYILDKNYTDAARIKPHLFYTNDMGHYIGRYLKLLKDAPHGGFVKAGDIGKIISKNQIKIGTIEYSCTSALQSLNIEYKLLPINYSPIKYPPEEINKNEAVLCTTQEEWDYVFSKYPGKRNYGKSILQDRKSICLNLENLYHASLNHYREEGYIIYSFQEWCEKFGHKPNFIKPNNKIIEAFYITYSEDFTEDLFNEFFEWAKNNLGEYLRQDVKISYNDFKERYKYIWVNPNGAYKYSQDNGPQGVKNEYSLSDLKLLINYNEPDVKITNKESELLEEAKRRYPLGTKVRSAYDSQYEFTIGEEFEVRGTYILCKSKEGAIFYIYYKGKWAEVINNNTVPEETLQSIEPEKDENSSEMAKYLISEAQKRYPSGTRVQSAYDNDFNFVSKGVFRVTSDCTTVIHDFTNQQYTVYYKGKWGKIIVDPVESKPYEYKIGDWCYIINKHNARLESGKVYQINDIKNPSFHFDDGSGKRNNSCWLFHKDFRLATLDEIKQKENESKTTNTYTFSLNSEFDKAVDKDLHEKSYNGIVASQTKNHLLDKNYSSILNKELQMPKRTVKQTKKLIY